MSDYEKLGVFYLGRGYDMATAKLQPDLLLYDSRDLVTHAVCVGMTGSGKTGLCLSLLEEAAIDGIPALIIDPKGDLTNLMLTFPDLRPEDFLPWVNPEDAQRKGLSVQDYAAQQAALWKKGLGEWGQDGERIRRFRDSVDLAIYTPGSSAGLPVSIMKSFDVPEPATLQESDLLRDRISATATALLGLLGVEGDPLRSREHILIASLLDASWKQGRNVDLPSLIQQIQKPPLTRVGVMDLESFFPTKDRFELSLMLNNLLAAPGFESWLQGEPLEVSRFLHNPKGKPRLSIFSIAHLSDAERMFFVSLLLNQTLAWMRTQPGTTSLRAILYMDEIFGYFPPTANPPSKQPLLTLLKQARAFGVGVVLASQNPVDLDYKGLSNAGTWFLGRLQTERDKARVLDGLEGATAGRGKGFDRRQMDKLLSGLGSRVFLMNNVHDDEPVVFQTRWALSYLCGPLTRTQIKTLMDPLRDAAAGTVSAAVSGVAPVAAAPAAAAPRPSMAKAASRPALPPEVPQFFVPVRGSAGGNRLEYQPMVLGSADLRFIESKNKVDVSQQVVYAAEITDAAVPVEWARAVTLDVPVSDLEKDASNPAEYDELPAIAAKAKSYENWSRDFSRWLYASQKVALLRSPQLGECSRPGEDERDFRIRLSQVAREQRDRLTEELRKRYAPRTEALQEKLRRAQLAMEREAAQASQQQLQTVISFGTTLLGAFMGRKKLSTSTLGRAATAARGLGRTMKERQDVGTAQESVASLQQQIADLEAEFQAETERLAQGTNPLTEVLESLEIKPKKTDIAVRLVALVWVPMFKAADGGSHPAWQ
jgi:hypothetical protein